MQQLNCHLSLRATNEYKLKFSSHFLISCFLSGLTPPERQVSLTKTINFVTAGWWPFYFEDGKPYEKVFCFCKLLFVVIRMSTNWDDSQRNALWSDSSLTTCYPILMLLFFVAWIGWYSNTNCQWHVLLGGAALCASWLGDKKLLGWSATSSQDLRLRDGTWHLHVWLLSGNHFW